MKLLTKAIEKKLKPLYFYDGKEPQNIPVPLKIFNPWGSGTWYLWEYDPNERVFFGACKLFEIELGYVSRDELENLKVGPGKALPLERDKWWNGKTLEDVIDAEPGLNWLRDRR